MSARIAIRPETPDDVAPISTLITAAFATARHSGGNEADIVAALRKAGMLSVSLVAVHDKELVGHAAFSPVSISDGTDGWYGLGPVATGPAHQRRGIGADMIRAGLAALQARGAAGCVVLGDPGYYGRFGFVADPGLAYPGVPAAAFQHLVLAGPAAKGIVTYSSAFAGN